MGGKVDGVNLTHLRTLQEVVRLGSFARTANRLGYTPSAISQQMAQLERFMGVKLFERTGRNITPTNTAITVAKHASEVLTSFDGMISAVAKDATQPDTVRFVCFSSLATRLLPQLINDARSQYEFEVAIHDPSRAIASLRTSAEFDVAIVYKLGDLGLWWPPSYRSTYLGKDSFAVLAPTSWGFKTNTTVKVNQLDNRTWIAHHADTGDAGLIQNLFASLGIRTRTVARSDDYPASVALIQAGLGAMLLPEFVVPHPPDGTALIHVEDLRVQRDIYALTPKALPEARTSELLTLIHTGMRKLGYPNTPVKPGATQDD